MRGANLSGPFPIYHLRFVSWSFEINGRLKWVEQAGKGGKDVSVGRTVWEGASGKLDASPQ